MKTIVDICSVSFAYPNGTRKVLEHCSMKIQENEIISILGPNGAGKSTLLNCACGLLQPQEGTVSVNEKNIKSMTQREIACAIAFVQQNHQAVFSHSVFDYVLMGRASRIGVFQRPTDADRDIVRETLSHMKIEHLTDSAITEISGGERQQAAIARAIVQEPQVILFDEPTAHLDYGNQIATLRMIRGLHDKGFVIVMTTHNPDHCIMLGGKAALLNKQGMLIMDECETLIKEGVLKQVYNSQIKIVYVKEAGRLVCIPEML